MNMTNHLVFYDGECGFCDQVVQFLLKADEHQLFLFAPLKGKTAQEVLKGLSLKDRKEDSLVLVENYGEPQEKVYILGKGAFRILWLLGGAWRLLGWISFLPSFLYNWAYRLFARYRHRFFADRCQLPRGGKDQRFLP
jgi:predicted DCC family thiol-disulfide oxidoreductase YuxK